MKKRFKLITTIASLCLAVALMAFGVYAATTASFAVNSTITFDVTGELVGKATVEAYIAKWDASANDGQGAVVKVDNTADASTNVTINYTAHTGLTADLTSSALALTLENCYVIYEVSYTKDGATSEANITIDNSSFVADNTTESSATVTSQGVTAGTSDGDAATLTAKYTPAANSNQSETFNVTFNVSLEAK